MLKDLLPYVTDAAQKGIQTLLRYLYMQSYSLSFCPSYSLSRSVSLCLSLSVCLDLSLYHTADWLNKLLAKENRSLFKSAIVDEQKSLADLLSNELSSCKVGY